MEFRSDSWVGKIQNQLSSHSGSVFKRNFLRVAKANLVTRAIAFFAAPILTRIYSPDVFGLVAIYAAFTVTILSIATWNFNKLLPNAVDDSEVASLSVLSGIVLAIVCSGVSIVVAFPGLPYVPTVDELGPILYFAPLSIALGALVQFLHGIYVRINDLTAMSRSFVQESVVGVTSDVVLGLLFGTHTAMLTGRFLGSMAAIRVMFIHSTVELRRIFRAKRKLSWTIRKFGREASWSTLAALTYSLYQFAPLILFGVYYTTTELGVYSLVYSYAAAPVALLGSALSKSFWSEAAILYRANRFQTLKIFYLKTVFRLFKLSLLAVVFSVVLSYFIGDFLGGGEWENSGNVLLALLPAVVPMLMFGTTNHLVVLQSQNLQFLSDLFGLVLTVLVVIVGHKLNLDFVIVVMIVSVAAALRYLMTFTFHLYRLRQLISKKAAMQDDQTT